jgi:hypothetical protein
MNLTKDTYEYLMNFADDRDIINMLSVNKKFSDEAFIKRVLLRKYPLLVAFKIEGESWKHLFVRMVYYISKLKELYNIPYIPLTDYDPSLFYRQYGNNKLALYFALELAISRGKNYEIIQEMLNNFKILAAKRNYNYIATLNDLLDLAVESGEVDMVKLLVKNGANDFENILIESAFAGKIDIVKYAMEHREKISRDFIEEAIIIAMTNGHKEIADYLRIFL